MQVLLAVATIGGGLWALIALVKWVRRRFVAPALPIYSATDLRHRLRILVIDDSGFTYLQDFERDGFNITWRARLDAFAELENHRFDVVVLDIHGVAGHLTAKDGLGVAAHLRSSVESSAVVIYSGASYQLTVDTSSADVVLDVAGSDYEQFRTCIESLFAQLATPDFYARNFDDRHGAPVTAADRVRLLAEVRQALIAGEFQSDAARYSSHAAASRAAGIVDHAVATARRLHRKDV